MSQIDQKIREMDFYFEDAQKTNREIEELMENDEHNDRNSRQIKKK